MRPPDATALVICCLQAAIILSARDAPAFDIFLSQERVKRMRVRLDATDWRILKELQADGRITNVALGLISGYHAQVDPKMLGFELTAFATVGLHSQAEHDLRAFENRVLSWPLVREAYMVSGETDYILKCVAPDLSSFQDFIINELTAAPNVASVKTSLAIRRAKLEPGVPITIAEE
jgi:DNA-binding Lrp family transcriptional regulator